MKEGEKFSMKFVNDAILERFFFLFFLGKTPSFNEMMID